MKVAVLPGDGIGPEITAQAARVLKALANQGVAIELESAPVGGTAFDLSGDPLPAATIAVCESADAILFGSVGGPQYDTLPRAQRPEQGLLRLRKHFDLFANLRPAIVYPELAHASTLKPEVVAGLDLLILRELTGDIYFGQPRGVRTNEAGEREGFGTMRHTESETLRIAHTTSFRYTRQLARPMEKLVAMRDPDRFAADHVWVARLPPKRGPLTLTVGMLTLNEIESVEQMIDDIRAVAPDAKILLVDSSSDRTPEDRTDKRQQIEETHMARRLIDISVPLQNDVPADPPGGHPTIQYIDHQQGLPRMLQFFDGLKAEDLPDGQGWAVEQVQLSTHNGTHLDAPWHFHPTMNRGERSWTIDEVPLEWCLQPGVKLDFRHFPDGYVATAKDVESELKRIGHTLSPLEIVVVNTSAGIKYGRQDYVTSGCGMGYEATMYLLERGVRLTGIDGWSWDAPFVHTAKKYAETRDASLIWEGHKAGRHIGYCHIEKLHNLEQLPSTGFTVSCFPVKIERASAGWTRAVAIIEG